MEPWSSRTSFVLAAVGVAVGFGNLWRFSAVGSVTAAAVDRSGGVADDAYVPRDAT